MIPQASKLVGGDTPDSPTTPASPVVPVVQPKPSPVPAANAEAKPLAPTGGKAR